MYLLLKLSRVNIKNHPIAKRLYQYRKILSQFESVFEETIKPQVEILLHEDKSKQELDLQCKKKTLQLLKKLSKRSREEEVAEPLAKKSKKTSDQEIQKENSEGSEAETEVTDQNEQVGNEENSAGIKLKAELEVQNLSLFFPDEVTKRAITYQIAKNKGLTPYRKKEQRNPRVKHRKKFRKAVIHRKGAVSKPLRETVGSLKVLFLGSRSKKRNVSIWWRNIWNKSVSVEKH